jgi:hypothetical protein
MTGRPSPEPARRPEDLSDFFLQRVNSGDMDGGGGATAEIARRQADGPMALGN